MGMVDLNGFPLSRSLCTVSMRSLIPGLLAGFLSVAVAGAQPSYSIKDVGALPGLFGSQANGINDAGDIVGGSEMSIATAQMTGFVLRGGVMKSIGKLPSGSFSSASSINASGSAVGVGDSTTPSLQALLFRNNSLLDVFPSASSNAYGFYINDAGVIVGQLAQGHNAGWIPTIWVEEPTKPGRFRGTTLTPFPGDTQAQAQAANQSIQVVGYTSGSMGTRGILWNNDANHTPAILQPVLETQPQLIDSAAAYAVNNLGVAVGVSWYGIYHSTAVVWSADASHTPTALPLLPGEVQASANGINNSGQVIGYNGLDVTLHGLTPVTWINGQIFLLQSLLDASGAGWQLRWVTAINNSGQIVGTGYYNGLQRGFVLTPNPL
jgi:uncharacterized membrane protein